MARAIMAGATDYSHQTLDDIVADLAAEAANAREFIRMIEAGIEGSKKAGYWDSHVPHDFRNFIAYAVKHYRTALSEVEDILADFNVEIKEHHCRRLYNIAEVAGEINRDIGKIWHQEYRDKDYGSPEFARVEAVYANTRDMAVNLLDFSNMAARLEHFVGRTKAVRNNPWISGSFYIIAVVLILAVLAAIANLVSWYALPVIAISGALLVGIIGALQLRNDDKLKEENFVTIMVEVYKRLPLLKHASRKKNV